MGEEYADVILVAENHAAAHHQDIELELIDEVQPEYVVMEDSPTDKDLDELLSRTYRDARLADVEERIADEYGTPLFDTDVDTILDRAETSIQYEEEDYPLPSGDELLSTPIYELPVPVIKTVRNSIFGRKHLEARRNADAAVTDELDGLAEFYHDVQNAVRDYGPASIRQFGQLQDRVEHDGISVVSEPNEYASEPHHTDLTLGAIKEGTSKQEVLENNVRIMNGRETAIGNDLVTYAEKTDEPVIGLIGKFHAVEPSAIYPVLEDNDVSYQTVWLPENDDGREATEYLHGDLPEYLFEAPFQKPAGTEPQEPGKDSITSSRPVAYRKSAQN